jgi:hypothetical protein
MTTQTEAERLADALEHQFPLGTAQNYLDGEAAAELRRLVSFNQQLMDEVARLQKREWMSLTNKDLETAYWSYMEIATQNGFETAVRKLEAKLKENNA